MKPVELALVVSLGASALAAAAPTFLRDLQASRMTEAADGLATIGANAAAYADGKELAASFPPPIGRTPAEVPRGNSAEDPPGTWDVPTWRALQFGFDRPHRYSFQFDVTPEPQRIGFSASAFGDLSGDGILSTFRIQGERGLDGQTVVRPGLYVHREVE